MVMRIVKGLYLVRTLEMTADEFLDLAGEPKNDIRKALRLRLAINGHGDVASPFWRFSHEGKTIKAISELLSTDVHLEDCTDGELARCLIVGDNNVVTIG